MTGLRSWLGIRAAQEHRKDLTFQPPEEVLRRRDSLDEDPNPRSVLVKTVHAALTTAVAFGAFAPHITTISELAPATTRDLARDTSRHDK
jgi:hypothetical protein